MTLANLSKILDKYELQLGSTGLSQFRLLQGLPFYCKWRTSTGAQHVVQNQNRYCCFNHAIGLPKKDGKEYELFDYELTLFNSLNEHRHIWCKKATGLGVTEFMLRYMAWLCFSDDFIRNSQMCIVTGPRIELAITRIDRMKALSYGLGVTFDS